MHCWRARHNFYHFTHFLLIISSPNWSAALTDGKSQTNSVTYRFTHISHLKNICRQGWRTPDRRLDKAIKTAQDTTQINLLHSSTHLLVPLLQVPPLFPIFLYMWYWILMRWKCPSKATFKGIAAGREHLAKILLEWWINLITCLLLLSYTSLWEITDHTFWAAWQKKKKKLSTYTSSPMYPLLLACFSTPREFSTARFLSVLLCQGSTMLPEQEHQNPSFHPGCQS